VYSYSRAAVVQNADLVIPISEISATAKFYPVEAGGCNPRPIFPENKTVTDETITISSEFLEESKGIFANREREY
jgi:hypothetical protein